MLQVDAGAPRRTQGWPWAKGALCVWIAATALRAVAADPFASIEAHITSPAITIPPGQPVVLEFILRNTSDEPVVLSVPEVTSTPPQNEAGLPLEHIFSGTGFTGLTIRSDYQRTWTDVFGYQPPAQARSIVLAPHAIVGTVVTVSDYYPPLRSPGIYRIVWQPYGGLVRSNQLTLEIAPRKQLDILTDHGPMHVKLLYDVAPKHVANIIELARSGFYNQKTFHRIEPGYFMQGGCPNGDGTGIRLDGKKLKAEFSDYPVDRGTVCMARLEGDPDSASCQFIIVNTRIPQWDGRYTVFGQLVGEDSFNTLEQLMGVNTDPATGRPDRSLYMRSVRVVDAPVDVSVDVSVDTPAKDVTDVPVHVPAETLTPIEMPHTHSDPPNPDPSQEQ